ncbi:MAG TPA: ATP-binding protein [Blastocatellia bacterium]|nr:ATP-binding protein [Blastocatellia bacterium]
MRLSYDTLLQAIPRSAGWNARYGMALLSSGLTFIVCLFLNEALSGSLPLTLFIIPVVISAWFGGLGPGMLATVLSALASDYFLTETHFAFFAMDTADWERLILFLATSGLVNWLIVIMRNTRRNVEAWAREAVHRQIELEEQIVERERARAERERLIAEIETERARLNAIVEHIPAGVILAEAPSGRIVLINPQVERILGRKMVLSPDIESYRDWLIYEVDGRPVEGSESVLARTLQGEVVAGQEILFHRGDGTKTWVRVSGAPIRDAGGKIVGGVDLITDIDEEKRASETLRINEQRLSLAQKASQAGSFEWNLQTNAIFWSEETKAIFGMSPDVGNTNENWLKCVHPEDRSRAEVDLRRAVEVGEGSFEYRVVWPDRSVRWIQSRGKAFFDEEGKPSRWIGINIDVTERKQMEESLRRQTRALREADRRKDEFLTILAHELRNPLAPISNAIRILALRGDDPEVVAQTREVMERQIHQMSRVVDDLLEVSRIGRGKISLEKAPVDLTEVVATAVETCHPLVEAHNHTLTVALPERPARVEGDSARLAQVLSNLLNNAAKYTEDGGRIELIVEQTNGEAVIRVRDNGIGIAPERLPTIFDMFEQVEGAADRSHGGLGIGLTLARRLVEMHGGRIEVHSAGLGKGSEFVTRLPALVEPAGEPAPESGEGRRAPVSRGPRRVLVVDDNVDSAESMAVLLRLEGHEVRLAHDGAAALEEARSFKPDVMFLDLDLPKMDGYEVARQLRLDPAMSGVTLVAMTGYGHEEERQRTREAGFQSHLVKPVDFDLLKDLLSSLPANQSDNQRRRVKAN